MPTNVSNFVLMALGAISGPADTEIAALGERLGTQVKEAIESTDNEFDDFAIERLKTFADAFFGQLN